MNKNVATKLLLGLMVILLIIPMIVCGMSMKKIHQREIGNQKLGLDYDTIEQDAIGDYLGKSDFNHSIFYMNFRYQLAQDIMRAYLEDGELTDYNVPSTIVYTYQKSEPLGITGTFFNRKGKAIQYVKYGTLVMREDLPGPSFNIGYSFNYAKDEDGAVFDVTQVFSTDVPTNEIHDTSYEYDMYYSNLKRIHKKVNYKNLGSALFSISIPKKDYDLLKTEWTFIQTQVAKATWAILICGIFLIAVLITLCIIITPQKNLTDAFWWERWYSEVNVLFIGIWFVLSFVLGTCCLYSMYNMLNPFISCLSIAGLFLTSYITLYYVSLCLSRLKGHIFIKSSLCYALFALIRRYIKKQPKALTDYEKILKQIDEISRGNLRAGTDLTESSPYYPASQALEKIGLGMEESVKKQLQEERMKIELVTNVSHDLKTPLTSIISYIDLLSKMENLDEEARDYISILEKKSDQLKRLVTDLFELAKSTSGEAKVDLVTLDMEKLCEQMLVEMDDTISESGREIVLSYPETKEPVHFRADADRMNRVFQNLLDNAIKYSMPGTRVFICITDKDIAWELSIKNTAAYRMNFTEQEILERFTRGDKARTTEGSGLGLSIAQSFTELCGGDFHLKIDGDQFNVFVSFPKVK